MIFPLLDLILLFIGWITSGGSLATFLVGFLLFLRRFSATFLESFLVLFFLEIFLLVFWRRVCCRVNFFSNSWVLAITSAFGPEILSSSIKVWIKFSPNLISCHVIFRLILNLLVWLENKKVKEYVTKLWQGLISVLLNHSPQNFPVPEFPFLQASKCLKSLLNCLSTWRTPNPCHYCSRQRDHQKHFLCHVLSFGSLDQKTIYSSRVDRSLAWDTILKLDWLLCLLSIFYGRFLG